MQYRGYVTLQGDREAVEDALAELEERIGEDAQVDAQGWDGRERTGELSFNGTGSPEDVLWEIDSAAARLETARYNFHDIDGSACGAWKWLGGWRRRLDTGDRFFMDMEVALVLDGISHGEARVDECSKLLLWNSGDETGDDEEGQTLTLAVALLGLLEAGAVPSEARAAELLAWIDGLDADGFLHSDFGDGLARIRSLLAGTNSTP